MHFTHGVYLCVSYHFQNKKGFFKNSINKLIFVMEKCFFAVGTESLNNI
jgi:hypothetical protein